VKVEISDESIDRIMVQELTQSLEWARKDLSMYDVGLNANIHVIGDPEKDKEELRKDIEAYERILNYWKVQS
jgi:hypothetical protein